MKTSLVAIVLGWAALAATLTTATPQSQAQTAAPAPSAAPAQATGPVIKDPAEYNAYVSAIQQQDPAAKISGLEAFVAQYPNSIVKGDALDVLMGAYQQTGNQAKVMETANRLLAVNPDSTRALVLLCYLERASAKWPQAQQHAIHGLDTLPKMPKPEGVSDADFVKQKAQFAVLLNSVAGFSALQQQDYPNAQKYLRAAVEADPANVENIYPLALAYLSATPSDDPNGLWFTTRAANLISDPKGKSDVTKFGHSRYVKYHGSDEGWNDLLAKTASTPLPPADFTITKYVPPTPAQQAHDIVKDKTPDDIKKLSFAEWELVLSAGAPEDADKVWNVIKGTAMQMEGQVMKSSPTEIQIAASQDDIDKKQADIVLSFPAAIPAKMIPAEGSTLDFEGTPVSYTPSPFVMNMEKGALLTKAAPKPATPVRKAPVRKKTQ